HLRFQVEGRKETPILLWKNDKDGLILHAANSGATFRAANADPAPLREALAEAAALLPELTLKQKIGLLLLTRPCITGISASRGSEGYAIFKTALGPYQAYPNGAPHFADLRYRQWALKISVQPTY